MAYRLGVSASISREIGRGVQIDRYKYEIFDVSVILLADKEEWHVAASRRLRPHFVRSVEEARAVIHVYDSLFSGLAPDGKGRVEDWKGGVLSSGGNESDL